MAYIKSCSAREDENMKNINKKTDKKTEINADYCIPLQKIIDKTSQRKCLFCDTNLDIDLGEKRWHIPLCKKHREEYLDMIYNK